MKITNKFNIPQAIVNFAHRNEYNPGASDTTVSRLIDSPRIDILSKRHNDEIEIDIQDLIPALVGTALHSIFEKGAEKEKTVISEERIFYKINGWRVSGQIDTQDIEPDGVIVTDYKSTSAWAVMNEKIEWEYQLNLYAYLVEKVKGLKVKEAQIVALVRDWNRRDVGKENYPESMVVTIPAKLWTMEEREAYLIDRLNKHAEADASLVLGGAIADCTPAEQWRSEETFAVYKNKNMNRAFRVFALKEEADKFASQEKDVSVVTRKAEPKRCLNWCRVAQFCDQKKREEE